MKAVLVPAEAAPRVIEVDGGLSSIQAAVEGFIEPLYHPYSEEVTAYCNEEGRVMSPPKPQNQNVGSLAEFGLDPDVRGNVILLGRNGSDEAEVPQWVIDLFVPTAE